MNLREAVAIVQAIANGEALRTPDAYPLSELLQAQAVLQMHMLAVVTEGPMTERPGMGPSILDYRQESELHGQ